VRDLRKIFGNGLRQARKTRKLSQAQLAEKAKLSVDMVGRLERGAVSPSFDTIGQLTKALGVPVIALFGGRQDEAIKGDRARLLQGIDAVLARLNDQDLRRLSRLISTFEE